MRGTHEAYIGDAVYVCLEHDQILLYTSDGLAISNEIFLEAEVVRNLVKWIDKYTHPDFRRALKRELTDGGKEGDREQGSQHSDQGNNDPA